MKYAIAAFFSLTLCATAQRDQATTQPVPSIPATPPIPAAPPAPGVRPAVPAAVPGVRPVNHGVPAMVAGRKVDPNALAAKEGEAIDGSNWVDQDIADAYTDYTGKRVLLSSATQNVEIRFFQRGPLTNSEAANLLDKVLNMEGYAFVPSGTNEVKLLPKAQGTGPNAPENTEFMIDDPNEIPLGDAYVSYFMKLGFIKPEEAVRTFTQSIHGLGPGAKIAPVPNASAVIITGKSSFIRKLINQKQYIDVAAGNVSTSWVTMKFADAEQVSTTLNEIMNSQQQRQTTAGVTTGAGNTGNRAATPPIPGNRGNAATADTGGSAAGEDIPVQIVADARNNRIFIMGRPVDIVFVEGLAREFDAPPSRSNFVKRRLRFMIAADFLDVASSALESLNGGAADQAGTPGGRQDNNNQNNNNNNQNNNNGTAAESVEEFNISDVPEARVIGKTLLVADNLANSILVQGPPESIRIVSELIDKLDGRPQQVMISTVFGSISLAKGRDVGVAVGAVASGGDTVAANSDTGIGNLVGLDTLTDVTGLNAATAAGLNIYATASSLTAAVRALETSSDFKVLSRPTVYTSNNRRAIISSGSRIAVPTNSFTGAGATGATQSTNIEFRDVLLRFEVVPLINSEDEVTLRISLLNEDTQGMQIIDGNEIPTIVTESIATTVTVNNNQTVVLGGLVTETETNTRTGVPVLSSIPALGKLFRRDVKDVDRRELLIFIQPQIINGEASLGAAQGDLERRYNASNASRDFAHGVLPAKEKPKTVTPRNKSTSTRKAIPSASKRPGIRSPTRR